jgi:hypothetical protein
MVGGTFENNDRLRDDSCYLAERTRMNKRLEDLMFIPVYEDTCKEPKKLMDFSIDNHRVMFGGYGPLECNVQKEERVGTLTHSRDDQQLIARTFLACPDLGRGAPMPDVEDSLVQGRGSGRKWCEPLEELDRFVPLIPCLAQNVQNPRHIVPTWTRGGDSTRDTNYQKIFLRGMGYRFDGQSWAKEICSTR